MVCATEPGKNLNKLRTEHTRNCLLMPICVESGYALLTVDNQVFRFDKKGNYLAGKIIEGHPQAKTWRVRVDGIPQKDQLQVKRIRVLGSNSGGIPEAKLGVDYVLPVRVIERYEQRLDERIIPVPIIPDQDTGPWLRALRDVLMSRASYERIASKSRSAALAEVRRQTITPLENFLASMVPPSRLTDRTASIRY